uniref:guanine nucleotide-binding protein G(I)/G(S)/G(O) subunit gamma-13-like n=1 Tax=Myxine glutinosa TaxID=7769 RepID=UPI00358F0D80
MEEEDTTEMQQEVDSLKHQLAFDRELASKSIPEFVKWIQDGKMIDPFLNPELMKQNPWVERTKCVLL